ncbi:hypothetical protein HYV50_01060 [Candidatus Pacearchaeota archaeon]|nr:hypothetical protein [Candidatus Pacearchaeota archaeon]
MPIGTIADILYSWESIGVYDFILPFLLVFALVFGILNATQFLGKNRPVYIIVALAISLMSLRYSFFVSDFLSELFPRLGIGLAVLLAVLIFVGLFIAEEEQRYWGYGLAAIGALIAIIIIFQTFDRTGLYLGGYTSDTVSYIILFVLLVGVIIAVSTSGGQKSKDTNKGKAKFKVWREESQ